MRSFTLLACLLAATGLASKASADVLHVGLSGEPYSTVYSAVQAANPGDTIEIASGDYYNYSSINPSSPGSSWCLAFINKDNLTLRGVGPTRPVMWAFKKALQGKGIWLVQAHNITIENIEFKDAATTSSYNNNASAIRPDNGCGGTLTVRNCYIHDCQNGMQGGAAGLNVVIDGCEFFHNGFGDGQTHNMYISNADSFTLTNSYSHGANVGHEVKTRARRTTSCTTSFPMTMATPAIRSMCRKGAPPTSSATASIRGPPEQGTIITYAEESTVNDDLHLYVMNNTIVNSRAYGTVNFVQVAGGIALVENNIFQGYGTAINGSAIALNNLSTMNAGLVQPLYSTTTPFDFNLTASSSGARDHGGVPSPTTGIDGTSLIPTRQYVYPLSSAPRPSDGHIDIGAYEYSTGVPIIVDAGTDQTMTLPGNATLTGSASGGSGTLTATWSKLSGPGTATFGDAHSLATTVTFDAVGNYVLQLEVTDGVTASDDTLTITANGPPPPTVQVVNPPAFAYEGMQVSLTADANDPSQLPVSYTWTQATGKQATMTNETMATMTYTVPIVSSQTEADMSFTVAAYNGYSTGHATVSVPVFAAGDVDHQQHRGCCGSAGPGNRLGRHRQPPGQCQLERLGRPQWRQLRQCGRPADTRL